MGIFSWLGGYDERGFNKEGINKYTKTHYDKDGYNVNGYDKDGYDKDGFNYHGYDSDGYNKDGYDKDGYDKQGYNRFGYNKDGYDKDGYDKRGLNKQGFNRQGYKDGYDINGFDKFGYTQNGYNSLGIDRFGFNEDGWDTITEKYPEQKRYDKDGYDINGFDRDGYDKDGRDIHFCGKDGYNILGYDKNGYDRDGYDKNFYNKEGIDSNGFDKNGINFKTGTSYDKDGFDRYGYNKKGIHRATGTKEHPSGFTRDIVEKLWNINLETAYNTLNRYFRTFFFFDTETTGTDPENDYIVQFAGILGRYDFKGHTFREIKRINQKINVPIEIPASATAVHGIKNSQLTEFGYIEDYIHGFLDLVLSSDYVIGHNISFDLKMLRGEAKRLGCSEEIDDLLDEDGWRYKNSIIDTMKPTTNIVKIQREYGGYKWPSNEELHEFLFGFKFEGAHDAMSDIEATKNSFLYLIKHYIDEYEFCGGLKKLIKKGMGVGEETDIEFKHYKESIK